MRHSDPWPLQSSATMSKTSAPVRSTRERVAISVVVGILTFMLVNMTTENDQGLGAGVVVTIIVWLLTAPRKSSEEKK